MRTPKPLSARALYRACDTRQLRFTSTDELEDIAATAGQGRAMDSLRFGLGIRRRGYNVFALGMPGVGKFTAAEELVSGLAEAHPVPADWCYLHNFSEPRQPVAVRLPAGRGARLRKYRQAWVEELGSIYRTFMFMPLGHSESVELHRRNIELQDRLAADAPAWYGPLKELLS